MQSVLMIDAPLSDLLEWLYYRWSPYQDHPALPFKDGYLNPTRLYSPKILAWAEWLRDQGASLDVLSPATLTGQAALAQHVVERGEPLELQGDYRQGGKDTTSVTLLALHFLAAGANRTELRITCPDSDLDHVRLQLVADIVSRWPTQAVEDLPVSLPEGSTQTRTESRRGASTRSQRFLTTMLFTDIVGSTERASEIGDRAWLRLKSQHDRMVRREVLRFRGREVKTTGDGFLLSFDQPLLGIACACAIRDTIGGLGIEIRCGLHTGEVEGEDDDITGIAVHIAARVMALAGPSEVLASSTVRDATAGGGVIFEDRGPQILKGIDREWRIFAVAGPPELAEEVAFEPATGSINASATPVPRELTVAPLAGQPLAGSHPPFYLQVMGVEREKQEWATFIHLVIQNPASYAVEQCYVSLARFDGLDQRGTIDRVPRPGYRFPRSTWQGGGSIYRIGPGPSNETRIDIVFCEPGKDVLFWAHEASLQPPKVEGVFPLPPGIYRFTLAIGSGYENVLSHQVTVEIAFDGNESLSAKLV